jgi:5-(carboxyamino)imidazole ribonucleotide synthase
LIRNIYPGATFGVFGSGQLGRMFTDAAHQTGYKVHCYSPEAKSPTGRIAEREFVGSYEDINAITAFAKTVQAVTFEFENVPSVAGETAEKYAPVFPGPHVLHICQHRIREKTFLRDNGFPVPEFTIVRSVAELTQAAQKIGIPGVLKTAGFGYDGKGQAIIRNHSEIESAWQKLNTSEAIYEAFVDFEKEISVIGVRSQEGQFGHYDAIENRHAHHILDISFAPAAISPELSKQAVELTEAILRALDVVGLLCVEMFVTKSGKILVNELAPRPHNSGHLTINACHASQFKQLVRVLSGMPPGLTALLRPAAMANLLGDLWSEGEPNWEAVTALPDVFLHLYGKTEARPGRKMGHLAALADTPEAAVEKVKAARLALTKK